jgi:protease IV
MARENLIVRFFCIAAVVTGLLVCSGCIKPKITLFPDATEPLREFTLQGAGNEKILIISISGFISDSQKDSAFHRKPSMVQEIVSQLRKAEKDKEIRAVILKIDSPGGSVTASDLLYHEITRFKERTEAKLVVVVMDVAASGGYYIALPADFIFAHPTAITGSIGVVFLRPNVSGLLGKVGIEMDIDKSGRNKDMGSPFRKATAEEQQIMQNLIADLADRFTGLVVSHRRLSDEAKAEISSARIYNAGDALRLGLVDQIGYLDEAIEKTAKIAGLPENPKVIVFRRTEYPDDNLYNTYSSRPVMPEINLLDLGLADSLPPFRSGYYYLWLPGRTD